MQLNSDLLLTRLYIVGGIGAIAGSLCVTAFYPQYPIWLAVLVGAAIGCPLLIMGFRMDPASKPTPWGRFWPTTSEAWGMLGLLAYAVVLSVPVVLFLLLFWLVPAGDNWPIVALRILLVTIAIGITYGWFEFAKHRLSQPFRGKLPDATIDALTTTKRVEEPSSAKDAAVKNWELLAVAVGAFLLAAWVMSFNHPGPVLEAGPRRVRGAVWLVQWCRGNPNTVVSSAILAGCFTFGLYVYRVVRVACRARATST